MDQGRMNRGRMKKIGILGGLAWPATVEYYKAICLKSQDYHAGSNIPGPSPMPEMCIESVDINYSFNRRGRYGDEKSWQEYDAYFRSALKRLEDSGADFIIIASNTPHTRLDSITAGLNIPVLSIFEAVAEVCKRESVDEFLLLGTDPTMNSGAFPIYYEKRGIQALPPSDTSLQAMVLELIDELMQGGCKQGNSRLDQVVNSSPEMTGKNKKTACLACTELPLAFPGQEHLETFEHNGVLYLNTTIIHVNAAFRYAIEE